MGGFTGIETLVNDSYPKDLASPWTICAIICTGLHNRAQSVQCRNGLVPLGGD